MSKADPIGYGQSPKAAQFQKGQSGNPRGRPKNRRRDIPYDAALGQMVTIRENGKERRVTAAEAFLLHLTQKVLAGDSAAARVSLEAIEAARGKAQDRAAPTKIIIQSIGQGIETILEELGLAVKKYPKDKERVRWELNPWIVEAALGRIGNTQLTADQQREVWKATRTPHKVNWPDWWIVKE